MKKVSLFVATLFLATQTFAGDIVTSNRLKRDDFIRRAEVWSQPKWLSDDFKFSRELDILNGSKVKGNDKLLQTKELSCQMEPNLLFEADSGKTPKFFCNLFDRNGSDAKYNYVLKKNGEPQKIKVKYIQPSVLNPRTGEMVEKPNPEIFTEIVGTRLLWALGFGADRMFFVDKVHCYNCPPNPFHQPGYDTSPEANPRTFTTTALETKMSGTEILFANKRVRGPIADEKVRVAPEGWTFGEMLGLLPKDPQKRRERIIQSEALMLLSVVLQHSDSKTPNHRIMCVDGTKEAEERGECDGRVVLYIQDIGVSFGQGMKRNGYKIQVDKLNYEGWKNKPVWDSPSQCESNMGIALDIAQMFKSTSEDGRQFLVKLLDGFTAGPEGKQRVVDLFRAGRVELFENGRVTAEQWADAFLNKVEQIKYPMGRDNPDFKCPKSI